MKSLKLLALTALFGFSTQAFAGGGGGGGVLQMASFAQDNFLVYGIDSDLESQLVAVAIVQDGKWKVTKEVLERSEVQRRPELSGAIRQSEISGTWAPVSKIQIFRQ